RETPDVAPNAIERLVVDTDRWLPRKDIHEAVAWCAQKLGLLPGVEPLGEDEHRRGPGETGCRRVHVPAQLAETRPVRREIGAADESGRVQGLTLALAQLEEPRERWRRWRRGDAVARSFSDRRWRPLGRPCLRLELDHLRAERDD